MKRWELRFAFSLAALSAVLLFAHYLVFRDAHHILIFTAHDIAFLPLEVLFVSLILEKIIERRERRELLAKVRMITGAAFSSVGTEFLRIASGVADEGLKRLLASDAIDRAIEDASARHALVSRIGEASRGMRFDRPALAALHEALASRQDFILRLFENPVLLGEEGFSDALRALYHLTEELSLRPDFASLPDSDIEHLSGDAVRAFAALLAEWVEYLAFLKPNYPYLYSLALRTNPFDDRPVVVVG